MRKEGALSVETLCTGHTHRRFSQNPEDAPESPRSSSWRGCEAQISSDNRGGSGLLPGTFRTLPSDVEQQAGPAALLHFLCGVPDTCLPCLLLVLLLKW